MHAVFAALASLIFLGITALEVQNDLIRDAAWPGYTQTASNIVFIVGPIWLLAAVCVWVRSGFARYVVLLAGLLALSHGVGVRIGGSYVGVLYAVAGPLALLLAWYGTPGRVLGRVPDDERARVVPPRRPVALAGSLNGHPVIGRDPGGIRIVPDPRRR